MKTKRRGMVFGAVIILVLALAAPTAAFAVGNQSRGNQGGTEIKRAQPRMNYVDNDGDGICDNYGIGNGINGNGAGFVDGDGDGVCDYYGAGHGMCVHGVGFVDNNADGICDNYTEVQQRAHGYGSGNGHGPKGNQGNGYRNNHVN